MTLHDFVESLICDYRDKLKPMDIETARTDVVNFIRDGWDLPEGITPESYMEAWNYLI